MDKELIFYLIFGLIYLLSRIGRKKKKKGPLPQPSPQQQNRPQSPPVSPPPQSSAPQQEEEPSLSFEDILRELSGEGRKKHQQTVEAEPEPEPEPVRIPPPPVKKHLVSQPTDQASGDDNRTMGERNTDAADLWGAYKTEEKDDRNTEAADLWGAYKTGRKKEPKLTTAEQLDKEQHRSIKFDEYDVTAKVNPLTAEIREMLEDPEDVRKAIVLAEILHRKY